MIMHPIKDFSELQSAMQVASAAPPDRNPRISHREAWAERSRRDHGMNGPATRSAAGLAPLTAEEKADRHRRDRDREKWERAAKRDGLVAAPTAVQEANRAASALFVKSKGNPEDDAQKIMIARMRSESVLTGSISDQYGQRRSDR